MRKVRRAKEEMMIIALVIVLIIGFVVGYRIGFEDGFEEMDFIENNGYEKNYFIKAPQEETHEKHTETHDNTPKEPELKSLGVFEITAYCICKECCGKEPTHPAYGITKSGTKATAGRTIAVDPNVIPLGTEVIIDGQTYIAEDTGSKIKGKRIDIMFDSHTAALQFGRQYRELFTHNES